MQLSHLRKKVILFLLASVPLFFFFQNCSTFKFLSAISSTPTKANSSVDLALEINDSFKEIKTSENEIRIPASIQETADNFSVNSPETLGKVSSKDLKIKLKRTRKKHK